MIRSGVASEVKRGKEDAEQEVEREVMRRGHSKLSQLGLAGACQSGVWCFQDGLLGYVIGRFDSHWRR